MQPRFWRNFRNPLHVSRNYMNINLPDKFYKVLILIGVIICAFGYVENDKIETKLNEKLIQKNRVIDSIEIEKLKFKLYENRLLDYSQTITTRNKITNPLKINDSIIRFNRIYEGTQIEKKINDSIKFRLDKYYDEYNKIEVLNKKAKQLDDNFDIDYSIYKSKLTNLRTFIIVGAILFLMGLFVWMFEEKLANDQIKLNSEKRYSCCQSCGKAFSSVRSYGKEVDNSINFAFCSDCFTNGKFTNENLTKEDIYGEIDNSNLTKKEVNKIKRSIPKLDRWKNNEYL